MKLIHTCCLFAILMAGNLRAADPVTSGTGESGAYYDWTKTLKPERPYIHDYSQTLVMGLFLANKLPDETSDVKLTCDQALEAIRKIDNLTLDIPKIVYVVGWEYNGHDSKYPSWAVINEHLKRPQDATAQDSMKWLMTEASRYHTTVSLDINMFDAYKDSPLWQEYVDKDIIAKDKSGKPFPGAVWPKGGVPADYNQSYQISYKREWDTGMAQRRIDGLLALLPIQNAGTIHIDAFHTLVPLRSIPNTISPYLGYTPEQEAEAQRKIFRYFRDRGVDVTCEMSTSYRIDPFVGLQPMALHFRLPAPGIPPSLYCGTPMSGFGAITRDPQHLDNLIRQFCVNAVPWYYNNNTFAKKGTQVTHDADGNTCLPALWQPQLLVAYSRTGYQNKQWQLPPGWQNVSRVEVDQISIDGPQKLTEIPINHGKITLTLTANQGVSIKPAT